MKYEIGKKAPFSRRLIAFLIDCVAVFLPAFFCIVFICYKNPRLEGEELSNNAILSSLEESLPIPFDHYEGYSYLAPALYESPILGGITMLSLPGDVIDAADKTINNDGQTTDSTNVSFSGTAMKAFSFLAIIYYLGYGTLCTLLYNGKTAGKYVMKIHVTIDEGRKNTKSLLFREIIGKILVNSVPIIPIISIFTIIFSKDHKAIHDMIGHTSVVCGR